MAKLSFTKAEEVFIDKIIGDDIHPGHILYQQMIENVLRPKLDQPNVTGKAKDMILSILTKVYDIKASEEIEKMLADDTYIVEQADEEGTRDASFQQTITTNQGEVKQLVFSTILNSPEPLSRTDIAHRAELRVSTVCARVRELILERKVATCGTKWDTNSERNVSILKVI